MPSLPLQGLRLLLLEDEILIAMDVEQLCRDNGAEDVVTIRDLAQIEPDGLAGRFDAAIVDLMLGGESTLDFAKRLVEQNLPFVIASGYSFSEEIKSELVGIAVVEKPYLGTDLVEALAAACGRSSPLQAADDPIT